MKVFDKIKDLFTDEVEEDEELPVKKEVIQVEIPAPKVSRRSNYEEFEEDKEDIIIEKKPVVPALPKKEEVSPFFDEKDFEDIKRGNYTLDDIYKEEEKEVEKKTYQEEKREAYSPKKEEPKKRFQPTPIISPVYGVLDKNYKKDDIVVGTLYLISNNFGAFVAVDDKYSALIPKKEMFGAAEKLVAGMKVTARVARVMDDGRLELAVRDKGYMQRNEDADKIFEMLKASGGKLDFYDKSDPELIREKTGMSKNEFKRAVGKLLKEDKIDIGEGTISLRN